MGMPLRDCVVWTMIIVLLRSVSIRVLTGGWNCEILYCGRWLLCEYVVLV